MAEKKATLLGAHMSIAGGFSDALHRGASIGCNTIQIFTKSNRQWKGQKPISKDDAELFKQTQKKLHIGPVVAHASYLINLGSLSDDVVSKSIDALITELERCHTLSIPYLVLHPGSGTTPSNACIEKIATNIKKVLTQTTSQTMILLEIMAGHGSSVGASFEQLQSLITLINDPQRIGVCFDTCHAWAAGYDFSTPESYHHTMNVFDQMIGLDALKVIHMNDSKKPKGSYLDRHENISKGTIGVDAFKLLMNDPRFISIPKILETPKTTLDDDKKNIDFLKSLIT